VLVVAVALSGGVARALECGDTVTASVTLTADLVCPDFGLFVGADDVTVDLGGHTISGPATPDSVGIFSVGAERVTVLGPGKVVDFDLGVHLRLGSGHLVRGVTTKARQALSLNEVVGGTLLGNYAVPLGPDPFSAAIVLVRASSSQALHNDVQDFETGILVNQGEGNRLTGNVIVARVGVRLGDTQGNRVEDNTLLGGDVGVAIGKLFGVATSNQNRVLGNRILDPGVTGVLLQLNPSGDKNVGNIIRANTVRGGQWGVQIEATNRKTRVLDNILFDQTLAHIVDDGLLTTLHGNVCWPGSC
jgi:hypothetical protein